MTHDSLRVAPDKLRNTCDSTQFAFETTAELTDDDHIIHQDRAIEAIRFGIGMERSGYNLFILGPHGTGKRATARRFLTEQAGQMAVPNDWCYVFNFAQPDKPRALTLPPGKGTEFSAEMHRALEELASVIPAAYTADEYELRKRALEETFRDKQVESLDRLRDAAQEKNIALLQTPAGFAFAPLSSDGEVISPDEYKKLPAERQAAIEKEVTQLQEELQRVMRQLPSLHRAYQQQLKELNAEVARFAAAPVVREVREKYAGFPQIVAYLDEAEQDIVEHFEIFMIEEGEGPAGMLSQALGISTGGSQRGLSRYDVNVVVDNHELSGAPVVFVDQPRFQDLIGRVEHVAQMGALVTDFTLIKAGAIHRANGGFLVIDALKLLGEPYAWEGLKRALRTKQVRIESLGQAYSLISTVSLDPEPIPLTIKVVLIGDRLLYYLLAEYDPEFPELFKVAADFEDDMVRDESTVEAWAQLIAAVTREEHLRPFDRTAVARVIEYGSRIVEDAERLTARMRDVHDLLREADYFASQEASDLVTGNHVERAIDASRRRSARIEDRLLDATLRNSLLIDTEGMAVGQVNGLSVYGLGQHSFGKPSRITARVRMGKGEVIDIERQVEMGGPIHSKGVMILSGYLGQRYAAERPLSLSATLVFEQSYGGVEGDSASVAETCALISALAEVPLKQSMAVTGSVNQHGQIQAVGGVNEKVEGFFDLCRARGLTGDQGVIIPAANVKNLMLRQDVVDAVSNGRFHIFAASEVDDCLALLTDVAAGSSDDDGRYPEGSVNGRVVSRIQSFAEEQRRYAAPASRDEKSEQAS